MKLVVNMVMGTMLASYAEGARSPLLQQPQPGRLFRGRAICLLPSHVHAV